VLTDVSEDNFRTRSFVLIRIISISAEFWNVQTGGEDLAEDFRRDAVDVGTGVLQLAVFSPEPRQRRINLVKLLSESGPSPFEFPSYPIEKFCPDFSLSNLQLGLSKHGTSGVV
jgi:hypothetical protein